MLNRTIFTTISDNPLLLFDTFIQERVIFTSGIPKFIILAYVIALDPPIIISALHLLYSEFLSFYDFIQLHNFLSRLSHFLLLFSDVLLALDSELEQLLIFNPYQMLILLHHVALPLIKVLLECV